MTVQFVEQPFLVRGTTSRIYDKAKFKVLHGWERVKYLKIIKISVQYVLVSGNKEVTFDES